MLTFTPSRPVKAGLADRLVFGGTLAVLVFAPLAFGSVHVWAYTICVMAVAVLLTLKALDVLLTPGGTGPGWVCTPLTLPAALLAVLAALQLAPLPLAWLARLSPLAAADRAVLAEVLARAGAAAPAWGAAAYHPHAAGIKSLLLLTAFGMWLLVVHTARTRQRIDLLAWTLAAVGLFEALYGLGQAFGAAPGVWWWPSRTAPMASGTFVGANHFASYLILVLPLTLGFAMAHRRPRLRMTQGLGGGRAALQRLLDLFAPEAAAPRRLVLFGAALVMGLGLLLSGSRGGIVALAAALLLTAAMMVRRSRTRQQGLLTILFCLAVLLFGLGVGIDHTMADFAFEKAQAGLAMRWERSKSLVPMLADYPLAGVGLGSWRDLYGRYVPEGIGYLNAGHAHNDWLEVGTELGLPGLAVMALGFAALWIKLARAWQGRRDPHALGLGAGVLAGITALALHSFFEFSLHIPANPLTLATVAGLGYAALHRHSRGLLEHFSCPTRRPPETGWARAALAVTLVLAAGLVLNTAWRHVKAEAHCPTEWNSTLNLDWDPPLEAIAAAIAANPTNAAYRFKAAARVAALPAGTAAERRARNERAVAHLEAALRRNPAEARYWFQLGKRYSFRDVDPAAYLDRWLPLADRCLNMAVHCAPVDSRILFDVAWYWVWRASILPEGPAAGVGEGPPATRRAGVRHFQRLFARSLELDPGRWREAVNRIREYFPDPALVLESLPPDDALQRRALRSLAIS